MTSLPEVLENADFEPYVSAQAYAGDMGLDSAAVPPETRLDVKVYKNPAETLAAARQSYLEYGVAMLGRECLVPTVEGLLPIGQVVDPAANTILDRWRNPPWDPQKHREIVKAKDFTAYNGTGRHMRTVSPENVHEYFPEAIRLQEALLPAVRAINRDPTTQMSVDPAEGTVINLQVFKKDSDPSSYQQHGAHTDRVDTTVVVGLANIGPEGNLVYLDGYTSACSKLGLDPHRHFDNNIGDILSKAPDFVNFRVHPIAPGGLVVVKTDSDVHLITRKTFANVLSELTPELETEVTDNRNRILGRGIINMAFETEACRTIDTFSQIIEREWGIKGLRGDDFFKKANEALARQPFSDETKRLILSAMVTRLSAEDLYG